MESFKNFCEKIQVVIPDLDQDRLRSAYDYAKKAYEGVSRLSGDPYLIHPLAVVDLLLPFKPDEDTIIAAIFHDVLKSSLASLDTIREKFGENVALMVERLWSLRKIYLKKDLVSQEDKQIENMRNMFLVLAEDLPVVLIRLADRLHNMRTLDYVPEEKRKRIAYETMHIYAPVASRFGIYSFKSELEDLSFKYLHPQEYNFIIDELNDYKSDREKHIEYAKGRLEELLFEQGIECVVTGRIKNPYSIFTKMKRKTKNSLKEIYDLFALRIILPDEDPNDLSLSVAHCYKILGLTHFSFIPVRDRFKDYIALPKPNGYRSLHTTVMGLSPFKNDIPTEIQIRTDSMHREAEYGIAAHWRYSEDKGLSNAAHWAQNDVHKRLFVRNKEIPGERNFDFFRESIFVLTPTGEVLDLPNGSTPVDFAYNLSSELGNCMSEAKVNGSTVALNYNLKNGDIVEIVTRQVEAPSRNWLSIAKSPEAKEAIKEWFSEHEESKHLRIGRDQLNKELKSRNLRELDENLNLISFYSRLSGDTLRHREAILEAIGKGYLKPVEVIDEILASRGLREHRAISKSSKNDQEILIAGERNIQYRYAKCCQLSGDEDIIGYVTRGRGISIHKKSCSILKNMDESRLVPAILLKDIS